MISSEVQRTLVKSPPELWAEVSDPALLARHLGELGEIRITRVQPEEKVEWEAEDVSGMVLIKPSGWGTKVTLTVTRQTPEPKSSAAPRAPAEPTPVMQAEPVPVMQAEPTPTFQPQPEPLALEEALEPEPVLEPRRGFFARLFRSRRVDTVQSELSGGVATAEPLPEPRDTFAAVKRTLAPETLAAAHPPETLAAAHAPETLAAAHPFAPAHPFAAAQPVLGPPPAEEITDISAKARAAEEVAEEEVAAVLSTVLDRLGAAHHRPFSRG